MRAVVFGVVLLAGACAPRMSEEEAQALVGELAKGEPTVDVCTTEGAAQFRAAVRSRARAMEQAGEAWPNFDGLEDDSGVEPEAVVVALGFVGGHIRAGDLRGEAQWRMRRWALEAWPEIGRVRGAAGQVCAEIFAVQLAGARHAQARMRSGGVRSSRVAHEERRLVDAIGALRHRLDELGVEGGI